MLGILLHGGDLGLGAWLVILFVLALAGLVVVAAFVGVIYLIGKRWPPLKASTSDGLKTEHARND